MVLERLVLCAFLILGNEAYKRYADPIQLAKPNSNNVYEFELNIARKLTMTFFNDNPYQHGTPVDYIPDQRQWWRRDPDQLKPCDTNYTMNPNADDGDAVHLDDVLILDGLHKRVLSINGVSPGLPIVVPLGAEVLLKVSNNLLMDSITIHVHGVDKKGLWFTDGVAYVQQCPIVSTNYYEYRFRADTAGTHWYHGHMQTDRGDGLLGGFIVIDEDDRTVPDATKARVTPSREYSIILQDWPTQTTLSSWMQLDEKTMKWMYGFEQNQKCWQPTRTTDGGNVGGAVPISALTINDKGWHVQDDIKKYPENLPLERFQITNGENILLRIVNGGMAQELMLHIENHDMLIVAADGNEVEPMKVDRLIVFPGERYDILVKGLDKPQYQSYRMVVETIQHYFFDWTTIPTTYGVAFLEYGLPNGTALNLPEIRQDPNYFLPTDCTPGSKCTVFNCPFEQWPKNYNYTCVSYTELRHPSPQNIDPDILKATTFTDGYEEHFINMHFDSHVDGFKFEFPKGMPYYHQNDMGKITSVCNASLCPDTSEEAKYDRNCNCFYHKEHKLNNIVQIVLFNMGLGGGLGTGYAHPFHVHGTHFYVMKVGWPKYNASGMIEQMNPDINCPNADVNCDGAVWRNSSWMNGAVEGMDVTAPTFRDTITLPVGGYIVIRFRATNPGWWFAHCHLVLHHMGGTAYAFRVGDGDEIPKPPSDFPGGCGYYTMPSIKPTKTSSSTITSALSSILVIISVLYNCL